MSESKLQKQIIDDLPGWNVKTIATNKRGTPDLLCCIPMSKKQIKKLFKKQKKIGVFVALEVKNPNGKGVTSKLQKYRIKHIKEAGGIAGVVKSLQEVKNMLQ